MIIRLLKQKRRNKLETTGVGVPSDGNIARVIVANQLTKLRAKLLEVEDLYYSFRDDIEKSIQETKYRLDKIFQMIGDKNEV